MKKTFLEKLKGIRWYWWIVIGLLAVYLINGIVFAFIIYAKYPDSLANGKKYPDQQKVTVFMSKIYPFPAAWVGSSPIWVSDLYEQLSYIRQFSEKTQQPIPGNSELVNQVLDQMIDTKILWQQAKKHNITVSKEDIDKTYKELVDQNNGEDEVKKVLNELYGMTPAEFQALVKDQLLRQKIQENLFVRVKASHILIKDEGKAKEVLDQVKKGEKSFEDLAKEFSEDVGSKDSGGDLGWFGRGMMVPAFEDAAFVLQAGQVTELVKTDFGYHIIKVTERSGQLDESYTEWFTKIKSETKIKKWVGFVKPGGATNVISPTESATAAPAASANPVQ